VAVKVRLTRTFARHRRPPAAGVAGLDLARVSLVASVGEQPVSS